MGEVINLNKYRKAKAKVKREKQAEVNRRLHGRTKAERAREELGKQRLTRAVDGARLQPPAEPPTAAPTGSCATTAAPLDGPPPAAKPPGEDDGAAG